MSDESCTESYAWIDLRWLATLHVVYNLAHAIRVQYFDTHKVMDLMREKATRASLSAMKRAVNLHDTVRGEPMDATLRILRDQLANPPRFLPKLRAQVSEEINKLEVDYQLHTDACSAGREWYYLQIHRMYSPSGE